MLFSKQVIAIGALGSLVHGLAVPILPSNTTVNLARLLETYDANASSPTPEEIQTMEEKRLKYFSGLKLRGEHDPVCIQITSLHESSTPYLNVF